MAHLLQLARRVNAAHAALYVQGQAPERARARLLLFRAARITLASGLTLLGLEPLDRM